MKNNAQSNQAGFTAPSFLGIIGTGTLLGWLMPSPWNVLVFVGMATVIVIDAANKDHEG
jgi:hypothetical protein